LFLGETNLQKGDTIKAIEAFEKYKSKSKDVAAKKEVDLYLKKIINN